MIKLTDHDSLSRETLRRRLAENHLKPWQKDCGTSQGRRRYVARMEDVLDLYAEQPEPQKPVVCFDESPTQLIGEARQPIPAAPGRPSFRLRVPPQRRRQSLRLPRSPSLLAQGRGHRSSHR